MSNTPTPPWRVFKVSGEEGAAFAQGTSAVLKTAAIWASDAILMVTVLLLLI